MSRFRLVLLALLMFVVILPTTVKAQEYIVKPSILIPADWKDRITPSDLTRYQENIIGALKIVQSFYARELGGKTFKLDDNVNIVYSPLSLKNPTYTTDNFYFALDGDKLLPPRTDQAHVIWLVGSEIAIPTGDEDFKTALMNHQFLLDLGGNQAERMLSVGVTAHELGHAFGLVHAGWANAHPCTIRSENECKPEAPRPRPGSEEYLNSIMGRGPETFPNATFNNTIFNPEIERIFQSPFINPQNDPAPQPISSQIGNSNITEITPNPVEIGQPLEIKGFGFGDKIGKLTLSLKSLLEVYADIEIISWSDNLIKISIKKSNSGFLGRSRWRLELTTADDPNHAITDTVITNSESSSRVVNLDFTVNCGVQKKPLPNWRVILYEVSTRFEENLKAEAFTDQVGKGILTYIVDPDDVYRLYSYYLRADQGQGTSIGNSIDFNRGGQHTASLSLSLDQCPDQSGSSSSEIVSPLPASSQCDSQPKPSEFTCDNNQTCASVEYEYIPGVRKCYNDFYKDESGCWQPKINPDGNHYHCDTICTSDSQCDSDQVCEESTHICKNTSKTVGSENPVLGFLGNLYTNVDNTLGDILPDFPGEQTSTPETTPPPLSVKSITINNDVIWSDLGGNNPISLSLDKDSNPLTIWVEYSDGKTKPFPLQFQKPQTPPEKFPQEQQTTQELPVAEPSPAQSQPDITLPWGIGIDIPFIGDSPSEPQPEQIQTCDPNSDLEWEYQGCTEQCPGENWYCNIDNQTYQFDNPEGECTCPQ